MSPRRAELGVRGFTQILFMEPDAHAKFRSKLQQILESFVIGHTSKEASNHATVGSMSPAGRGE